ncbi:hypothetical protein AB0442_27980 [Kitasatospora sp. NPDC085895]|uniref:hypothetical protein n=1 Tax=Kitasatospora sp. NPDC085895 TaxID=3155057 RepID=UPI00344FB285
MSHPLTRRIAQAALLVAAGATPLIAAGSASAADLVPQGTDLGSGLTQLDSPSGTVQGAAHELGQSAGTTGAATVATGVPAAGDAAGHTVASALPDADTALGPVTNTAGKTTAATGALTTVAGRVAPALVDRAGPAVAEKVLPAVPGTRSARAGGPLGTVTGALPTSGLPTGTLTSALPTGGIPQALPGADALGTLTGSPAAANRLGGVPSLGSNPTDLLGGVLGGTPLGGLLGGIGGIGG